SQSLKAFGDYREMLEQVKPEIVICATPDHWHPLITIAALKSGAHVYLEKPVCHTIAEGIAMVRIARETGKTVQVGTHRRASPHNISAMEFLKSGRLGKIGSVRAFVHYQGGAGSKTPDAPVPEGLDWDMYCGPAQLIPFNPRIHPGGFRYFSNFANGQLGDWGIHWLDQVLWWAESVGENAPKMVASSGGRFIKEDSTDTPDCQNVVYQFDQFSVEWEHRNFAGNAAENTNIGVYFYGTKGTLHLGWLDGWSYYKSGDAKGTPEIHEDPQLHSPSDNHNIPELWDDFIDAIETGKRPMCDIELGNRSTQMSLLGMMSLKLGRSVQWDGEKQMPIGDEQAVALMKREYRAPWVYPE
ncbi:MAG: Gfo/Idh/MocA family oxidoreductase, partial [Planctomycetaceae bacterium]|nr:Gfo/Idh/MocA family oxidoreductase [Planctomycetaceae bacterium]